MARTTSVKRPSASKSSDPAAPQVVVIHPLQVVQAQITIEGISPLIMHAWSDKAIKQIEDKHQLKAKDAKEPRDPEAEFQSARYKIPDTDLDGIPVDTLKACAVEAGLAADIPKTHLRKSFFVVPTHGEFVPIICEGGPVRRRDMVRIGMGTADTRYRPEYTNWSCTFTVEFNSRLISLEQLVNLFDVAGYSVGIGEWRPQKSGRFGRFRVVNKP